MNDEVKIDPTQTWDAGELKHEAQLTHCRFSPCGKYIFAGSYDATLQRWNRETEARDALVGHNGWIVDLAFHPDGVRLFSVDTWGKLCAWDYAETDAKPVWSIDQAHRRWIRSVRVSPDGKLLATCGNDNLVRLWSADDGKQLGELAGHERHIYSVAFHPDGKNLVSGDLLGIVKHWDISHPAEGKLVRELDASPLHNRPEDRTYDAGGVRAMAFKPDGTKLVASGITELKGSTVAGHPGAIVFDWGSGKQDVILRPKNYEEEYKIKGVIIEGLAFHRDGYLVAVGGNGERQGAMWFWNLEGQDPLFEVNKIAGSRSLDISPDATQLAVSQFEPNGRGINGGNGRKATPEEYHCHHGIVRLYNLTPQPAEETEEKKAS